MDRGQVHRVSDPHHGVTRKPATLSNTPDDTMHRGTLIQFGYQCVRQMEGDPNFRQTPVDKRGQVGERVVQGIATAIG